jgi:hypothetical protein
MREEALGQPGVGVVEREMHGHGPVPVCCV